MDKRNFAFGKTNFILLAIGMAIVVLGFILMSGESSGETRFNPEIFSALHVKVAPVVTASFPLSELLSINQKMRTRKHERD